jgi:hypothetical protein
MQKRLAPLVTALLLALPPAEGAVGALAVTPKRKVSVVWKQALGPAVAADRWGEVQVLLVVRKKTTTTTTATGRTKKTVKRRITAVRTPVYPNTGATHTISLNKKVIPLLAQQVLEEQFATTIDIISEATDTSTAFEESLQVALANARRV